MINDVLWKESKLQGTQSVQKQLINKMQTSFKIFCTTCNVF